MAGEYQLSYTGPQVNEKLGKIDGLEVSLNQIPSTYETKTDAIAREKELKELIGSGGYILPTASANTKGGIKVGSGLTITGEVLSYELPTASSTKKGAIKIGSGLTIFDETVSINTIDNLSTTSTTNPLSATQGKILNEAINEINNKLDSLDYGDMYTSIYDKDGDNIIDNSMALNGHPDTYFMTVQDPSGTGSFSLNREPNNGIGAYSVALGYNSIASALNSFSAGENSYATGNNSYAEGKLTLASGEISHAEGLQTKAAGSYSHSEGNYTSAIGDGSHNEGVSSNLSNGAFSKDTPNNTIITAWISNKFSLAKGNGSHVEGSNSLALADYAHAEGNSSNAQGESSHAEGYRTTASSNYQHVQGKYNISDENNIYQHIVGNGETQDNLSNAHTLDWEGNAWFQGDVYVGSTSGTNKDEGSKKLITFDEIPTNISAFTNDSNYVTETGLAAKGFLTTETDPTVPDWAKAATKPSYSVDEITNALSSTLLNEANGIAILDENKNLITNEGINVTNSNSFYFIDSQERVVTYIDTVGVHAINIYTTDREYTKDSSGNPIETIYNLNYELAKLQQLYPLIISDTEPEDALFWIDTSV